jgi:hypothetical protein
MDIVGAGFVVAQVALYAFARTKFLMVTWATTNPALPYPTNFPPIIGSNKPIMSVYMNQSATYSVEFLPHIKCTILS